MKNKVLIGLLATMLSFFLLSPVYGTEIAKDKAFITTVTTKYNISESVLSEVRESQLAEQKKVAIKNAAIKKQKEQAKALEQFSKDFSIFLKSLEKPISPKIGTQPKHKPHLPTGGKVQNGGSGKRILPGGYICWHGCITPKLACQLPTYICKREALYIDVQNPTSSACGKYQFVRGTWASYKGYARACDAPENIQDEKAILIWNNGKGASHWSL